MRGTGETDYLDEDNKGTGS